MAFDSTRARLQSCAIVAFLPVVPLTLRLLQLQVLDHRRLNAIATGEVRRSESEIVPRGRVLDRDGRVLVESLPSWSAYLDPTLARGRERDWPRLARVLSLPASDVSRKARARGRFAWLKRKLSPSEAEGLKALGLPFVGLAPDERRAYPGDRLAASLLGTVGTEGKGLSGLELAFDRMLSGKAQKVVLLRDGAGHTMSVTPRPALEPPPDLTLTIDRPLQHYAEAALGEAMAKHQAAWGAVLIQDPRSGELLAMASQPADPLRNRLIQDVYEPGSTFKAVTTAAALEEGLTTPTESIDCRGPWEVAPGVSIKDHEAYGTLSLEMVMANSSNVGAGKLGLRLGAERFHRYARAFGFGARTGVPFPGESAGLLKPQGSLDRVSLANNAFGQGLAVTPLQMLAAYSAIANGGDLLEPRLVRPSGSDVEPVRVRRVASKATVRAVSRILEAVVEKGTGKSAAVPGYSVAGKTGTSQKMDPATRRYSSKDYIASFAGFLPASDPRFTILVIIDSPKHQYYGSEVAAPVFAKIAREALALRGVPPDRPLAVRPGAAGAGLPVAAR